MAKGDSWREGVGGRWKWGGEKETKSAEHRARGRLVEEESRRERERGKVKENKGG